MAGDLDNAVAELEALVEATEQCQEQLRLAGDAYRTALARLRAGEPVRDALSEANASAMRPAITRVMEEFETARRTSRIALMVAEIAEGSSVTDVARTWGVSHQLVSRHVLHAEEKGRER
jgi:hypothetical protein